MKYTHSFNLRCHDLIKDYFSKALADFNVSETYFETIELPDSIMEVVNAEFAECDLVPVNWWLAFKKRNAFGFDYTDYSVHVDAYPDNTLFFTALIIPIEGYVNAPMVWFDGNFTNEYVQKYGYGYSKVVWKDDTDITVHQEDIVGPTMCRVDIPHSAYSPSDGSYRAVASVRFKDNPTFEEICEKLINANK